MSTWKLMTVSTCWECHRKLRHFILLDDFSRDSWGFARCSDRIIKDSIVVAIYVSLDTHSLLAIWACPTSLAYELYAFPWDPELLVLASYSVQLGLLLSERGQLLIDLLILRFLFVHQWLESDWRLHHLRGPFWVIKAQGRLHDGLSCDEQVVGYRFSCNERKVLRQVF